MYYPMNLKGEIWKVIESAIGESSSKIIGTGINSVGNGYEANEVVNDLNCIPILQRLILWQICI